MTEEERIHLVSDYQGIFNTPAGLNILNDISRFCLENSQTFNANSERMTSFNEGARSVILYIRKQLADKGEPRQTKTQTERT